MFPAFSIGSNKHSTTVGMLRMLREAGCDIANEHDLQTGIIVYNVALLACRQANQPTGRPPEKSPSGRNDPCPCGSGRKYKKCCLDTHRPTPAGDHPLAPLEFGLELLPRPWNEDAMYQDCKILGRIIDRDPAFSEFGFSSEKIDLFMERVVAEDPTFMANGNDEEAINRTIDNLGFRYARESGEAKILRSAKGKFLEAISRAQSKDEVRALATGIFMGLVGESSDDPELNLLNVIFFRTAVFKAIQRTTVSLKVMDQLGCDSQELRRLIATNDPSISKKIESCFKDLTASELENLQATLEKMSDELWDTISAGEFPVPLPFATQLALSGRFEAAKRNGEPSPEEFYKIIEAFSKELIEEDYVLYGQMLDRWLTDEKSRSSQVANSVHTMAGFCATRSIEDWAPALLVRCGRRGLIVPFDEEEGRFINDHPKPSTDPEFVAAYGAWLASKGYPGLADRLRTCWERPATGETPDFFQPRKMSVG